MKTKLIALSIFILNALLPVSATEILFHRGECEKAPQNTVESYKAAWKSGCKYLEADFWFTESGEIFLFHMPHELSVMWGWDGGEDMDKIRFLTKEEVSKLKLIDPKWKYKFPDAKVPTADDLFATIPSDGNLMIDLKSPYYRSSDEKLIEFTKKIDELCKKYKIKREQIIFGSTVHHANLIKKHFPGFKTQWALTVKEKDGKIDYNPEGHATYCRANGIEFYGIGHWLYHTLDYITPEYVKGVQSKGIKVGVWTENDVKKVKKWFDMGVDLICTDKGGEFVKELKKLKREARKAAKK